MDRELFKTRLIEVLEESGRSRMNIADSCGMSSAVFNGWIGDRHLPSAMLLADFCKEMKVSMDWICGLSDRKELK